MHRSSRLYIIIISLLAILLLTGTAVVLLSQTPGRELIREPANDSKLVALAGNTRPEAVTGTDLGEVSDALVLDHMLLQLKRSPERERAVVRFIDELHDPASPNFHRWLTAEEFGSRFGLAEADLRNITGWLESHGFTVNRVYPSRMVIDFSGNAAQVRGAFHTSVHNLDVAGERHIANMSDPMIPAAFAPAVAGIVSMHDFRPRKMSRARTGGAQYTYTSGGQTFQAVVPADLAAIYDFNPLFAKGVTGMGQTVAVLEDTDLYRASDWITFRLAFGLSQYSSGTLTTVQPGNCSDPGVNFDDSEAILDAEWASAAAPGAAIEVAACANSAVTSGLYIAGQNLVNAATPPSIVSISYGGCEAENGASSNASTNSLYQQAVAEGISIFVAAGDEGAASCDAGSASATHGIGVSAQASTPYNVAVGGTDFSDVMTGAVSQYWSKTNTATYGSAMSYVPEIPWDDSCANGLFAQFSGFSTVYGANGFCNSNTAKQGGYVVVAGGSGGPSNCATGAPATFGVVDGSCQGYAKPSWQAGVAGIPGDGVRDIPDVSMFASDGAFWGRYSVVCFTDSVNGGAPCTGAPSRWAGFGGTSLSSPVMAGVQALVNQSTGSKQGNPNPVYYAMAVKTPSAFHPVTQGDIDVNCNGPVNCYGFIGTVEYGRGGRLFGTTSGGALSTSGASYQPAYTAGGSWSFASGLGSVDVNNLVTHWGGK